MLGVEAAVVGSISANVESSDGVAHGVERGGSGNAATVPLLPSFSDAHGLRTVWFASGAKLAVDEPAGLAEEGQQEKSGEELRTSEAFASEIWAHKAEPSVLPWRGLVRLTAGKVEVVQFESLMVSGSLSKASSRA